MTNTYTLPVITLDNGELGIELPKELLENLSWNTETELILNPLEDGKISLVEKD